MKSLAAICASIGASIGAFVSSTALAQTPASTEIVVTATRTATDVTAGTGAGSTLTEADLERRQTRFVVDALATLPGVTVSQNGAFGGQASVRLRGASTEQTLVLIDGVPVTDPSAPGGGFNAAYLDAADVARIDVLRGPQSTLWGSDAIGGVVAITTRRPSAGGSVRAFAEAGSFGTMRAGASFGYGGDTVDARAGFNATGTDGISQADERDGNRETDDYDSFAYDGRVGWTITDALRIEAFGRRSKSDGAFDSFGFATGVVDGLQSSTADERSGGVVLRAKLFDGALKNTVQATGARISRRNFNAGAFSFGADGRRNLLRYQGDFAPTDAITIAFGAEREEIEARGSGATQLDGVFALAEWRPSDTLLLTAGLRRDDHSRFGEATTGRLGARWEATPLVGVRASYGEGFKAPSLFQLTSSFGVLPPNTALQPEQAEGWDAAVFGTVDGLNLSYEIGYFDLSVSQQIDFSFVTSRYENIAKVDSRGVEAVLRLQPTNALNLTASYSFTDAKNGVTGVRLIRIPRDAATLEASWRAADAVELNATLRYNGEETDVVRPANPAARVDSWTRLDIAGRWAVSKQLDLYARVENVTEEDYQDVFGYGTPERALYVGARVRVE